MTHMRAKLIVAGVVLAAALSYLALAGVKKGWVYYLEIDAFLPQQAQYAGQRIRVSGNVAAAGFNANAGLLTARFDLEGKAGKLPVVYKGTIPDMFKPSAQVVVEGQLDAQGVFQSDLLMTKCASKYDSKPPEGHGEKK